MKGQKYQGAKGAGWISLLCRTRSRMSSPCPCLHHLCYQCYCVAKANLQPGLSLSYYSYAYRGVSAAQQVCLIYIATKNASATSCAKRPLHPPRLPAANMVHLVHPGCWQTEKMVGIRLGFHLYLFFPLGVGLSRRPGSIMPCPPSRTISLVCPLSVCPSGFRSAHTPNPLHTQGRQHGPGAGPGPGPGAHHTQGGQHRGPGAGPGP